MILVGGGSVTVTYHHPVGSIGQVGGVLLEHHHPARRRMKNRININYYGDIWTCLNLTWSLVLEVESIVGESGGGSIDKITMVEDGVQARVQAGVSTEYDT